MSNADKIRSMSNEELADLINHCHAFECNKCMFRNKDNICVINSYDEVNKNKLALDWLQEDCV